MSMKSKRRKFGSSFKAKVAIEAIKEQKTLAEIAKTYQVHPNQVSSWKREFLNNADQAFGGESKKDMEKEMEKLYTKIGKLEVERDFLKKNF